MIAIADSSKAVDALGGKPVPLELLPTARAFVTAAGTRLGARPVLRLDVGGAPARTDQGNIILDCRFANLDDPESLAKALDAIPGLLGHGLFVSEIDALFVGEADGSVRCKERLV